MPEFTQRASVAAPVEEVWKLLFDPTRFPQWWVGIETVRPTSDGGFTQWPTGYPDFPMPQRLRADRGTARVTVSCQVSDIDFVWQLHEDGTGTVVEVRVVLPEAEEHRLAGQRDVIAKSLKRLAALAQYAATPRPAGC
jgi:uncharacterized protein YndB with AHSA1/START domain